MSNDAHRSVPRRAGDAALHAIARIIARPLIGALGDPDARMPTPKRARFIITNVYSRPRFSSPTM